MLSLRPVGGLCNRLLAINSAIALSQYIQVPLHVIWEQNALLNCPFSLLFKPLGSFSLKEESLKKARSAKLLRKMSHFKYQRVISTSEIDDLLSRKYDFSELKQDRSVLIYGCKSFYPGQPLKEEFLPVESILKQVSTVFPTSYKRVIGLHIRRTDHQPSITKSSSKLFIQKIEKELQVDPNTLFFLATDSPKEETLFKKNYPKNIVTHDKDYSRESVQGIKDALVDLLCLSKTEHIYGSFFSSFSVTAAKFSNIKLTIVE